MSLQKQTTLIIVVILFCLPQFVMAASHEHHKDNAKPEVERALHMESQTSKGVQLSPGLLDLLNQEMVLIQQGVMDLVPAIAAGEWVKVSAIGQKIKVLRISHLPNWYTGVPTFWPQKHYCMLPMPNMESPSAGSTHKST